jgi:cytidine deaminase
MKKINGKELASEILSRSVCSVQVGSAVEDAHGIFSWGWNSVGSGHGQCAEKHAILRANRKRLQGATIYVASIRRRNKKLVPSKPCKICQQLVDKYALRVIWRDNDGSWIDAV